MTNPFLKYTPEETAARREAYLRDCVVPIVRRYFHLHPELRCSSRSDPPLDLAALAEAAANRAVGVDRQRLVHGAR